LTCATRGEPQPYARSIPGFVKGILKAGPAELDGVRVFAEDPPVVSTDSDVDDLVNLLERPSRRASVIVFALPDGSIDARETAIDAKEFQGATLGAAHVRVITGPASYHLTDRMGKELSVFRSAVRIYRPGFSRWRDQPTRHPLFLPERIASWASREAVEFPRWLVDSALALTLHRGDRETELPAFNTVRQTAARVERDRLKQSGGSSADLARMYEEDNEKLRKEVEELKEEYEGLLDAAESEREQAQQEAQEYRARTFALRDRIRALEGRLAEAEARPVGVVIPDSLDRFEEWVRQHLSGSVELHNRAYQGVKKSVYENPALIYASLLLLRDYYVPMRVNGGNAAVNAFEARCRELQVEDALVGEALRTHREQYTVSYEGKPRLLDRHLKRGAKHDEARCFRLYYFWDDEAQCVVVGWLPSHLDNSRT
jgi:FtsZ-binding cell division protein ZapB